MYEGCYTAIITPFNDDTSVDYEGLGNLVDFQVSQGVDGILAVGTTGESPTLSWDEHEKVIRIVHERAGGKVRVIAGTGSNNTKECIKATRFALGIGIDSVLLIDPYYNGPSSLEIRREYLEPVAREFPDLSIIPYVIPGRTGTHLLPQDIAIANSSCTNINGVKEATGNLENARMIRSLCSSSFSIISGDDEKTLDMILDAQIKATGVISVSSNIAPAAVSRMVKEALQNNSDGATEIQRQIEPLFDIVTINTAEESIHGTVQVKARNPLPTKTLMSIIGMPSGRPRKPLGRLTRKAIDMVVSRAIILYENSKVLNPIEDFFDVDIGKRLYSDDYRDRLYYESY